MIDNDMDEADYEQVVKRTTCPDCGCNSFIWEDNCNCESKRCGCYINRTDDWSEFSFGGYDEQVF